MTSKLTEGLRVRTTRPVPLWSAHWAYLWEKYGSGSLNHDVDNARQEGYYFEPGKNEPLIPKGATGTIREYARYITEHERPLPSFITKLEGERRLEVENAWRITNGKYPIIEEHIIFVSDDPPEGGHLSWTMFGIDFDEWGIGENRMAGLIKDRIPDYLEVIEQT